MFLMQKVLLGFCKRKQYLHMAGAITIAGTAMAVLYHLLGKPMFNSHCMYGVSEHSFSALRRMKNLPANHNELHS